MKSQIQLLTLSILLVFTHLLTSCDTFDEKLPECSLYVTFKYDYNMLSVDAFHTQVDKVELYVFDKDGKFLFTQAEEGEVLKTGSYRMEVPLTVGEYKFMAWAGAHNSYEAPELTRGVSEMDEAKLKLKRDNSLIITEKIESLWYGEIIDVNFNARTNQTETINLIKDTNKVKFGFMGATPQWTANVDDYNYEIVEANGYLNYDNSLLDDDVLSYQPYSTEQESPSEIYAELNTMRLMADRKTRFVVTEKESGIRVFDINMNNFLIMTAIDRYSEWSKQEYFDRQDEFAIVFVFSGSNEPGEKWLATQVTINDWTYYLQTEEEI